MKLTPLLARAIRLGALAAIPLLFAASASAQGRFAQSGPIVYRGLDCTRCGGAGTYCVVNPFRFEYTCAPTGTYACTGFARTSFCRYGTTCWNGICQ